MPRDKTESHARIVEAAMAEFLEKGFEQASMKSVADAVGMTSAALYRHFESKQDMFASLVQPAADKLDAWRAEHISAGQDAMQRGGGDEYWGFENDLNDARAVLEVMYEQPEAFKLLMFCSVGTPYENFVHDIIEQGTDEMMSFIESARVAGMPARNIERDEMHMLVSAYVGALVQPIEHGYDKQDAERYLRTIVEFFTPGWRWITGM